MLRKSAEELDSVIRDIVGRSEGLLGKIKQDLKKIRMGLHFVFPPEFSK